MAAVLFLEVMLIEYYINKICTNYVSSSMNNNNNNNNNNSNYNVGISMQGRHKHNKCLIV